jgi:predicted N-acetyltransferase YhbS
MDCAVHFSPVTVHAETRFDISARERLLDAAFGPARFAKTCERLRAGRLPAEGLAFTARADGKLIGTIRLWDIVAGGVPALLLGPLAVDAAHEGRGIGTLLMRHALAEAARRGHKAVILVGDAPYYARFGFSRAATENLLLPGPVNLARFLGLELVPDALAGAHGLVIPAGRRDVRRAGGGHRRGGLARAA